MTTTSEPKASSPRAMFAYDEWIEGLGLPIHRGFAIPDLRTLELEWWEERKCKSAFVQFMGQEGVSETRVTKIPPGETLPAYQFLIDEAVYVLAGNGLTNVWEDEGGKSHTFEWQAHSMFLVPRNSFRQFSNVSGTEVVRLLHYSYLPLAMSVVPEPDFFLNNPYRRASIGKSLSEDHFSEAKAIPGGEGFRWITGQRPGVAYWYGNLFPDLLVWDRLDSNTDRGAGGKTVRIQFADSDMSAHMSVFGARTYK